MQGPIGKPRMLVCGLVALLSLASSAYGRQEAELPPFQYAGGTQKISQDCAGNLQLTNEALIFKCPAASIRIPFASIILMEYRADISQRVRKLDLNWKVQPIAKAPKRYRYFTVVYKEPDATQVVVLMVAPRSMRPYLAEIELKSGKRVEVMGYEDYL
jgi:hypothetical protein